jgi:hypothetical protein
MLKKYLIPALVALFFQSLLGSCVLSQSNAIFDFSYGGTTLYELNDIRKIKFQEDVLEIHFFDGTIQTYNVSIINEIRYNPFLGLQDQNDIFDFQEVNIFPNPSSQYVNLKFKLNKTSNMQISILDMKGATVFFMDEKNLISGEHSIPIDISNFESGNYILKLKSDGMTLSKRMQKNN